MQGANCPVPQRVLFGLDNVVIIHISVYALWFCALTSDALCSNWDKEDDR